MIGFFKNIGKINFKNTTENLVQFVVYTSLGALIGYTASTKSNKQVLVQLIPTIEKAIDKETITNEIINKIELSGKFKKVDTINIKLNPNNNQKPTNIINSSDCYISKEEFKTFSNSLKRKIDKAKN